MSTPNLAAALVALQTELPKVHKGKTATVPTKSGGSYKYTYADLVSVTDAAMPVLTRNGLAFTACPRRTEDGRYELAGVLMHTSGETVEGALPLHGGNEQAMGSSITYARRYLLGCMTGIVTDDDEDGALASQTPRTPEPVETPEQTARRGIAQAPDSDTLHRVMLWAQDQGVREAVQAEADARMAALTGTAA